jgi:hypothetical protein
MKREEKSKQKFDDLLHDGKSDMEERKARKIQWKKILKIQKVILRSKGKARNEI